MFQLAVNARISFPDRNVTYLNTEGKISIQRLNDIALSAAHGDPDMAKSILSGILITEADKVEKVSFFIDKELPSLFQSETEPPPSIIIIDSIAALFRIEYDEKLAAEKTKILFSITTTLKWISELGTTGIFITNQATANMGFGVSTLTGPEWIPALGYSWSNCINVRLRVTKTQYKREYDPNNNLMKSNPNPISSPQIPQMYPVRTLFVEISPIVQDIRCEFIIDTNGIHGI